MKTQTFHITSLLANEARATAERRESQRFMLNVATTIQHVDTLHLGTTEDISDTGIFVATNDVLAVGEVVTLGFTLPGRPNRLSLRGVVEWTRAASRPSGEYRLDDDAPRPKAGMGIRFVDADELSLRAIRAYLQPAVRESFPSSSRLRVAPPASSNDAPVSARKPPPLPTKRPDRRAEARFLLSASVTLEGDNNFYAGLSEDISEGGLFIATYQMLPIGTPVVVRFTLPTWSKAIELRAKVQWIRGPEAIEHAPSAFAFEISGVKPGMGLRFDKPDPASLKAITTFLKLRTPDFFE